MYFIYKNVTSHAKTILTAASTCLSGLLALCQPFKNAVITHSKKMQQFGWLGSTIYNKKINRFKQLGYLF